MSYLTIGRCIVALLWFTECPMIHAEEVIPTAYRCIAAEHEIPLQLFYAVALAESGKVVAMRIPIVPGITPPRFVRVNR